MSQGSLLGSLWAPTISQDSLVRDEGSRLEREWHQKAGHPGSRRLRPSAGEGDSVSRKAEGTPAGTLSLSSGGERPATAVEQQSEEVPVLGCNLGSIPTALRHPLVMAGCLPTPACLPGSVGLDYATCSCPPLRSSLAELMP